MGWCLRILVVATALPAVAAADGASLFTGTAAAPLISMNRTAEAVPQRASLFIGQAASGLFGPRPERTVELEPQPAVARMVAPVGRGLSGEVARLQDLIASVEAGPMGYDAVQYGARVRPDRLPTQMRIADIDAWIRATPGQPHAIGRYQFIPATLRRLQDLVASVEAGPMGYDAVQYGARVRPDRPPTQMRIADIDAWIRATPNQPHAIGRYQFIPATLRRLVRELGIPQDAVFTPALQDLMAERLLYQAGMGEFASGAIGRTEFMNRIARVWAGLPNSSGRSHYDGYAGNAAGMSWASFEREMLGIFPGSRT